MQPEPQTSCELKPQLIWHYGLQIHEYPSWIKPENFHPLYSINRSRIGTIAESDIPSGGAQLNFKGNIVSPWIKSLFMINPKKTRLRGAWKFRTSSIRIIQIQDTLSSNSPLFEPTLYVLALLQACPASLWGVLCWAIPVLFPG